MTKNSRILRTELYPARRRYGSTSLPTLPSLKRTLEPGVLRATSHQRQAHPRSHALRKDERRVGGCFPLVSLSFPRFPASLRNVMVFCAVELARARGANVLIICRALWRETIYIVERYIEKLPLTPLPTTKQFSTYFFSERGLQNPVTKLTSKEASSQVTAETTNRTPIPVQRGSPVSQHFSSDGSRGFASGAQGFQATGPRSR